MASGLVEFGAGRSESADPRLRTTATHCPYCSLQCGIDLTAGNRPASLLPQQEFPTNRGGLCSKGWSAAELLDHPEPLTEPMVRDRRGGHLRIATWDEALDRIAGAITETQQRYRADAVGCFGGGGLTTGRTRCSPRSTGAARRWPTPSPARRWTRSPGCRSSRPARSRWPATEDPRTRSRWPAPAPPTAAPPIRFRPRPRPRRDGKDLTVAHSTPRFLQGTYTFEGRGLHKPDLLHPALTYVVPAGSVTQTVYFRGGNSTDELVTLVLLRDGRPMRYFPIGAKGSTHVPLRVVEDLLGDTKLELHVAAPEGTTGTVVVDLGMVEV